MGRGRAANYDDQRVGIQAQAAALFAQRGYPATTMLQVAAACGLSKATLYHYYDDKYALLVSICESHVDRLAGIVNETQAKQLPPEPCLRELITRFVAEYAGAQNAHRVLTEDVKFLAEADRERVLDQERRVVRAFSDVVGALRPDLARAALDKPLTMLLFGMINWLFTWMKPEAALGYAQMAQVVEDLFLGGLPAVRAAAVKPRSRGA